MLFVNKFCSRWKYYAQITPEASDLSFKRVCIFNMNPAKSTIGTNWNIFTFNSKNNDMMPLTSFYCLHLNWTDFTPCSSASFANFEQVIVRWERSYHNKDNLSKQDIFFHLILKLPNLCWDTFSRRWNNNGGISTVSTIH